MIMTEDAQIVGKDPKGRPIFKNTFIPRLKNPDVSVPGLLKMLSMGAVKLDDLPANVQTAVRAEISAKESS